MAEEAKAPEPEPETAAAEKKGLSGKAVFVLRILVGILCILLLVGISTTVTMYLMKKAPAGEGGEADRLIDQPPGESEIVLEFLEMGDPFVALPTDENGVTSASLRVSIKVGFDTRKGDVVKTKEEFQRRKDVIRNRIIMVLLGLRPSEFRKNQAQQYANLQSSIHAAINQQMPRDHQVDQVIFTEFVFQ